MAPKPAPNLASAFKGRWRIEVMDLWDRDVIDLIEPGFVTLNGEEGKCASSACAHNANGVDGPSASAFNSCAGVTGVGMQP
jgi:hypothetical protein